MDKFIFLDSGKSMSAQYILADCKALPNVEYLNIRNRQYPKLISRLMNAYSYGIAPFKWIPLGKLVNSAYTLKPERVGQNDRCFVITYDGFAGLLTEKYLETLSSFGYTPCLLYLNSIKGNTLSLGGGSGDRLRYFKNHIYTFDQYDASRFGLKFIDSFYSKLVIPSSALVVRQGIYYIGKAKDRLQKILSFCDFFRNHGVDFDFNIMVDHSGLISDGNVKFKTSAVPYTQSVNDMLGFSTIFDITEEGQHGATLRYYEAVVYNKKLVTTNPYVRDLYYYNPEYMKIVQKPEDIDVDWLKEPMDIDYGYDGRFSPVKFLKLIQEG